MFLTNLSAWNYAWEKRALYVQQWAIKAKIANIQREKFADSLNYITLKTVLVDKHGTWQYIEKNSTQFINEQLD